MVGFFSMLFSKTLNWELSKPVCSYFSCLNEVRLLDGQDNKLFHVSYF